MLGSMATETGLETLPELRKLQKKLSSMVLIHQEQIQDLIHCEWVEVQPVDKNVFDAVISGLLEGVQLEIHYSKQHDQPDTERSIDPLKLINYQGRWYLLAWCVLRREKRIFHLSRITRIRATNRPVTHKPESTDTYLTEVFGIFKGSIRFTATIKLTGRTAETVREQHWHPDQQVESIPSGILLRLPVADDRELIMKILQFGEDAEVIAPESLRRKIKEKIERMAQLYT
jgi:predicted DNA-binding transcriptional regulator YafY